MLKLFASYRKELENELWFRFADCIEGKDEKGKLAIVFTPNIDFTEILIKLKINPDFVVFYNLINIINDGPDVFFNNKNNLKQFIELCEQYGKEIGTIPYLTPNTFPQRNFTFILDLMYFLLNSKDHQSK